MMVRRRWPGRIPTGCGLAAALLGAACAPGGIPADLSARDSAGVRIVEHAGSPWGRPPGFVVRPTPSLDLGTADGAPELQFDRIAAVRRMADGRIAVANGGSSEIRFFDAGGAFLGATGRPGGGPGEYRQIISMGTGPADSIWVYDFGLRRFAVLDAAGAFVRHVRVGTALSAVDGVGRWPDGAFALREFWGSGDGPPRAGLTRDPVAVAELDGTGEGLDTLALFPGREVFIGLEDGRAVMSAPALARTLHVAMRNGRLAVGDPATFDVALYDAGRRLALRVRFPDLDLRRTADDLERFIAAEVAELPPEDRAAQRRHFEGLAAPDSRPAFGELVLDRLDRIWISDFTGSRAPRLHVVFARDGTVIGTVEVPAGFRLHDAGEGWILGVGRDALDVEHVLEYRLEPA